MVAQILEKYLWLIDNFLRAGERGLSLDELKYRWESRFGGDYPRRTFNNHRAGIAEAFNIDIECDRAASRYLIRYPDDVTDEKASAAWLINTFTVNNMLALGKERLSGRISVEDIPSGHLHLTRIMDAMLDGNVLKVTHKKYAADTENTYTLHPLALKEASRRWYLVAYCVERKEIRVYGLDRIISTEITDEHFIMPKDFDVEALFSNCYGVYLNNNPPCEILFRASDEDSHYLIDLPLHKSQKEVSRDEKGVVFSIFVSPDRSLMMDFLRRGTGIEVLSPESLRKEVETNLRKALKMYE